MTMLMAWLMPAAGPVRDHLAATIDRLAAEHKAPRFEPHITMAGLFHPGEEAAAQALTSLAASAPVRSEIRRDRVRAGLLPRAVPARRALPTAHRAPRGGPGGMGAGVPALHAAPELALRKHRRGTQTCHYRRTRHPAAADHSHRDGRTMGRPPSRGSQLAPPCPGAILRACVRKIYAVAANRRVMAKSADTIRSPTLYLSNLLGNLR